jgi:hypothetical protein
MINLLRRIRGLQASVETGLDPDAMAALDQALRATAPSLEPDDLRVLRGAMGELHIAMRDHQDRLRAGLGGVGDARRATKGYGYLRSSHTGQKIRRVA